MTAPVDSRGRVIIRTRPVGRQLEALRRFHVAAFVPDAELSAEENLRAKRQLRNARKRASRRRRGVCP